MESLRNTQILDDVYIPDLLWRLWKRKFPILFGAIIGAAMLLAFTFYFITPLYEASVTLYVNNSSTQESSNYITQSDLSASVQLVNTYNAIILSDVVMQDVIDTTGIQISIDELANILDVSSVNNTEVFKVTVRYQDPEKAAEIVNVIAEIVPDRTAKIVKGSSVEVINYARVPTEITFPDYKFMSILGFAIGMILVSCYFLLKEMMDTRIKTVSDFARWKYPLLVSVPNLKNKNRIGQSYDKRHPVRIKRSIGEKENFVLSEDTPFAIQEAYNTLRTNIVFSSPDVKKKVIVVTSSVEGECKSTTAINLALCFAQDNAKVLLVDCDLRLPTIAEKMELNQSPGLTDLMLGEVTEEKSIHVMQNNIHVMTSGTIPPNPTVILGSSAMQKILNKLSNRYDYIVIDTPPLETMPDATILSKYATDVVLIVRQNTSSRAEVDAMIRKLEFAKAHILGFAFTCVTEDRKKAYRKYNYQYSSNGDCSKNTSRGQS